MNIRVQRLIHNDHVRDHVELEIELNQNSMAQEKQKHNLAGRDDHKNKLPVNASKQILESPRDGSIYLIEPKI